ncbi:MAG TPA: response regulator [Oculatellaceae cyanobacterium]|jgi:type IV pili sensor histidine kinase/response regulator
MALTQANLEAILQEARACFLYEDAPDYLAILEQGIERLKSGDAAINLQAEYKNLMLAAHTIKGGAGLSELDTLSQLAHKLEDLLQALLEGRVADLDLAYELLNLGVEQISDLIAEAASSQNITVSQDAPLALVTALEDFLNHLSQNNANLSGNANGININPSFIKIALEIDLEDCLQKVENLLPTSGKSTQTTILHDALNNLVEECLLLGQTLNLTWLVETSHKISQVLKQTQPSLVKLAPKIINYIRQQRSQTLNPKPPQNTPKKVSESLDKSVKKKEDLPPQINKDKHRLSTESSAVSTNNQEDNNNKTTDINNFNLNLRIPVTKLDRMSNTVGELLINHESLYLYQAQLHQVSLMLKKQTQQMEPLRQQVKEFYDQMATPLLAGSTSYGNEHLKLGVKSFIDAEFDALEFDQYSGIHTTLQDFQEVMVRVEESRSDLDLLTRELQEGLQQLHQQLDSLRNDLTESRLLQFKVLADRFVAPLKMLNERYNKSVDLEVIGGNTLIDQVILEQLQTPLTHLLRNAFDHGIESNQERIKLDKLTPAKITLSAVVKGNQVLVKIADDGRGIDYQKIYKKAVKMGLCRLKFIELSKEEIIEFLFMPGFSTAATVTDISGRGVGLDVVRSQVARLQGSVKVKTELGQGTTFTITVPLTLSILPLLLCRCQQQTLAIPSINVLEIVHLAEYGNPSLALPDSINWRKQNIPLFSLIKLLPYTQLDLISTSTSFNPNIGIVLDVEGELIVVAVDALIAEKELVLKPFDKTIPIPAYLAGCTVLGTGEVVPVLSPSHLGVLIAPTVAEIPPAPQNSDVSTILIVDDSIAVRRLLNRILTQSGYQVVECRDGKEALEKLNQSVQQYDLVISDIEMPRMDGFALLKEIRAHDRWYNLPTMMLTSRENQRHREKAASLGAIAYYTKPFHPAELLNAIALIVSH